MTTLNKTFLIFGALSLMTTGMLSAYGFHGLAETLTEADRLSWRWAVQIQAYASIGLLLVTMLDLHIGPAKLLNIARSLFILAIVVFSGTVYLEKLGLIPEAFGNIDPLGGSSFMLAWGLVAVTILLKK
ncbi:MAG: DUF423 domain-containing protein [Gammaproteobacteria bacterium]|jgi:uncharacterized membrane protein YgdD (TMEM256/DUF423 family)|nr:hypothetical protein [Chromatiales bacterium]MDP6674218.1 DUF423 domain-containing protein [Gammaproteobacteria bacterium]